MQKIVAGIQQFQQHHFGSRRQLFERLAKGQAPQALLITCSDSRIDPNLITQTEPGELFVLRNAGNMVPPYQQASGAEQATIEFALEGLGISDIIVCGHSHCGAVQALISSNDVSQSMPALATWLQHADPVRTVVHHRYAELPADKKLSIAVQQNVLVQLANLQTHPSVAHALEKNALRLHDWVYKFETGQVFSFDPDARRFVELKSAMALTLAMPGHTDCPLQVV